MAIQFNLLSHEGFKSLSFVVNGELCAVNSDHPRFDEIFAGVSNGDESVVKLIKVLDGIKTKFEQITDRVAIRDGNIYFDGDVVNDALSKNIVKFYEDDEDYMPLVMFMEKVAQNPNEHSREHLYRWLKDGDFTITAEGEIVGYKGVRDDLTSVSAGPGIVNGVEFTGRNHLDNSIGNVVEMPRSSVEFDPQNGCSVGLHVGSWSYASTFGRRTLSVVVNPRDVVSVPVDCNDEKMRVCRYRVVEEVTNKYPEYLKDWSFEEQPEDDDFCEDCEILPEPPKTVWTAFPTSGNLSNGVNNLTYNAYVGSVVGQQTDTRQNHKKQVRDANGRFVKTP